MMRDLLAAFFCRTELALRRRPELKCMAALRELQRASPHRIAELQRARLSALIERASRTPYYREYFHEHGVSAGAIRSPSHLASLPVLTKKTLQERLDDLLDSTLDERSRLRSQSGGSTGIPTVFYHDRAFWHSFYAASWLGAEWCGYHPGDRQTYLWGADSDAPPKTWKSSLRQYLENNRFENAFHMSEERMEQYARELTRWRGAFLWSYVSSATYLARFVRERGLDVRFRAIRTTAETLTPAQREFLETTFCCKVFDQYGSRELGIVAHECEAHQGLHVISPNHWVEILPQNGDSVGRLVITDLTNGAMPFLRYDTGDLARWAEGPCPCGRTWPRLERVFGRVSDVLTAPSGKRIHGEFFTHLFYKIDGVRQFQVLQEDLCRLRIRIAYSDPRQDSQQHIERLLEEEILSHGDPDFRVVFERVERIEPSPSGKYRFTMSALEP